MSKIDFKKDRLGYLYVSLAAILFAISGASAKFLFNDGITAFQLIQMRTTLALVGLLTWLCLKNRALRKISTKDFLYFTGLGVFGIGSAQFFYLLAISKINVAAAILLHYTGPVFVVVYVGFVQKQKLKFNCILAMLGTLIGCFLVVGAYNLQLFALNRAGIIAGIMAAVSFAVYSILSEYGMRKYTPWTVLLYGMLFAALMWYRWNYYSIRFLFRRGQTDKAYACQHYRNPRTDIGRCFCGSFFRRNDDALANVRWHSGNCIHYYIADGYN